MTTAAYDEWAGNWYAQRSTELYADLIRKGTALVIEDAAAADVGSIGSYNILEWKNRGCVGVVTSATARDTDEITMERVPLYFKKPGRGIRPGRNELESVNRPIVCGGVLVVPGDIVVADGDGVVVVPRSPGRGRGELCQEDHGGGPGRATGPLQEGRAQRRRILKK